MTSPPSAAPAASAARPAPPPAGPPLPGWRLLAMTLLLAPASRRLVDEPLVRLLLRRARAPRQVALAWLYGAMFVLILALGHLVFWHAPLLRLSFVHIAVPLVAAWAVLDHVVDELGRLVRGGVAAELVLAGCGSRDLGAPLVAVSVGLIALPFAACLLAAPLLLEVLLLAVTATRPSLAGMLLEGALSLLHAAGAMLLAGNLVWEQVVLRQRGDGGLWWATVARLVFELGTLHLTALTLLAATAWTLAPHPSPFHLLLAGLLPWTPLPVAPAAWFLARRHARRADAAWAGSGVAERFAAAAG